MKKSEIEVGKTYHGKGGYKRLVTAIKEIPDRQPDVIYKYVGRTWQGHSWGVMWLPYFAKWAKGEVKKTPDCFKPTAQLPGVCWWWAVDENDENYCSMPDWEAKICPINGKIKC